MGKGSPKLSEWFKQVKQKNGLTRDPVWLRWLGRWLLLSLALHLIAVASSTGFYHVDEHFQVVEPLSFKLGKSDFAALPVEFQNHTAPWLQSWGYFQIIQFAEALGVENPLQWSLGFRLFSALLAWLAQVLLTLCLVQWQTDKLLRRITVVAFVLFWSLPAFHARHSSENFGGALFFSGLAVWVLAAKTPARYGVWALSGVLIGLATHTRYSLVLCALGFLAWVIAQNRASLFHRAKALNLARLLGAWMLGFLFTVLIAFFADSWGYGEWEYSGFQTLTRLPLAFEGLSVSALWTPFVDAISHTWPIWGLTTYGLLMAGPWLMRGNPIAWSAIPLLLWTHLVPGNELNDLYPLIHIAPILLVQVLARLTTHYGWSLQKLRKLLKLKAPRRIAIGLVGWYAVSFLSTTLIPAWIPSHFYTKLYAFRGYALNIHFLGGEGPFESLGLPMHFYRPQNVIGTPVTDYSAFASKLEDTQSAGWLFHRHASLPKEAGELAQWCSLEISTLPAGLETARRFLIPHSQNWSLYKCKAPERSFASREKWDSAPLRAPASAPKPAPETAPQPLEENTDAFEDPEFSIQLTPPLSHSSL